MPSSGTVRLVRPAAPLQSFGQGFQAPPGSWNYAGGEENEGLSMTLDRENCIAYYFPRMRLSGLGFSVQTSAASAVVRLGLRLPNWAANTPGQLVVDAGTVDASSTGWKLVTFPPVEIEGWYFRSYTLQGASGVITRPQVNTHPLKHGLTTSSAPATGWGVLGYHIASVSGALTPFVPASSWSGAPHGAGNKVAAFAFQRATT